MEACVDFDIEVEDAIRAFSVEPMGFHFPMYSLPQETDFSKLPKPLEDPNRLGKNLNDRIGNTTEERVRSHPEFLYSVQVFQRIHVPPVMIARLTGRQLIFQAQALFSGYRDDMVDRDGSRRKRNITPRADPSCLRQKLFPMDQRSHLSSRSRLDSDEVGPEDHRGRQKYRLRIHKEGLCNGLGRACQEKSYLVLGGPRE